jgi:aspartate/tyrosine/aromatic aminotransferase
MVKTERIGCREFPLNSAINDKGILPLYQSGPMNTVGFVASQEAVEARAKSAAANNTFVILDRAYPGFEYARLLNTHSYDDVMRMSYDVQIKPFIEQGAPFALAIGPTKAFVSFALRPSGVLLLFCPDSSQKAEMTSLLNTAMRARGSAFEHPVTRAFAKALIQERARLEAEHQTALERLAKAEALWRNLVQSTPMEYLYADNYAGLFRNPKAREGAEIAIYNEHIYPVFANQRCRQNVTGIPDDEELARKHVKVFAEQCY